MDRAKIFKDYFVSSQNAVLIPNEQFGRRKFLNVGINRSLSLSRIEELQQDQTGGEMRSEMSKKNNGKAGNKKWIHPPDNIVRGHVLYTVKFLGECEVEVPKGTDVVKDAIRKRKFNKSIRKTEGQKTPKVELSISIDGVSIQDIKTKMVRHQYPLHRISYCADDKSDKRMFTFIAKEADENKHFCYVFASDRNAEEITLTIGQAFDLAYRRFLESQNKAKEISEAQATLRKKVDALERENSALKSRIRELEQLKDRSDIEKYKQSKQITDLTKLSSNNDASTILFQNHTGESSTDSPASSQPGSPKQGAVGRRLENLVLDTGPQQQQTNGTNGAITPSRTPGIISPPPASSRSRHGKVATSFNSTPAAPTTPSTPPRPPPASYSIDEELASVFMSPNVNPSSPLQQDSFNSNHVFDPFAQLSTPVKQDSAPDAFGMPSFTPDKPAGQDFLDLQAGFSQGLSFGTEEFGMEYDFK